MITLWVNPMAHAKNCDNNPNCQIPLFISRILFAKYKENKLVAQYFASIVRDYTKRNIQTLRELLRHYANYCDKEVYLWIHISCQLISIFLLNPIGIVGTSINAPFSLHYHLSHLIVQMMYKVPNGWIR